MTSMKVLILAATIALSAIVMSARAQTYDVFATAYPFDVPEGVVRDGIGNIYVANSSGPGSVASTVVRITPAGAVSTVFTEPSSYGFTQLFGVALDSHGGLFVADATHSLIFEISPSGSVSTFAGPDQGLVGPTGLVFDGADNLYVSNANINTVTKI